MSSCTTDPSYQPVPQPRCDDDEKSDEESATMVVADGEQQQQQQTANRRRRAAPAAWVAMAASCFAFLFLIVLFHTNAVDRTFLQQLYDTNMTETDDSSVAWLEHDDDDASSADEDDFLLELKEKLLEPKRLLLSNQTVKGSMFVRHQFLHLHHMKTGGTSLDQLIRCGMQRLAAAAPIPYNSLHECGESHYASCVTGEDRNCVDQLQDASVMSFCGPLFDLMSTNERSAFSWIDDDGQRPTDGAEEVSPTTVLHAAVTVLRHPVERVWSMFRFQTKSCYQCRPLKEIYEEIDSSSGSGSNGTTTMRRMCRLQLLNHQTRNLLTLNPDADSSSSSSPMITDEEMVQQAIRNMRSVFTMIGLTEELPTTAKMVGRVFPWLAEQVTDDVWQLVQAAGNNNYNYNNSGSLPLATTTIGVKQRQQCPLPHANKSPSNNRCGNDGGHWDLPDHPDEETAALIRKHNALDLRVYEAAVRQFALQKQVLGL
jgi:hypothetical protein